MFVNALSLAEQHLRSEGRIAPMLYFSGPGGEAVLKIRRKNVAERLCRLTGEGLYRDSVLLGHQTPLADPLNPGKVGGQDTPLGIVPSAADLNTEGLDVSAEQLDLLLTVDTEAVKAELPQVQEHLARFEKLPVQVREQFETLKGELA